MTTKLKSCPFCGESNARAFPQTCKQSDPERAGDRAYPIVRCMTCYCEVGGENFPKRFGDVTSAITEWNTRTGNLIPRDEITPQMAAEVLLSDPAALLKMVEAFDREDSALIGEPSPHDRSMFPVDEEWVEDRLSCGRAALTAIKESKDD